MNQRLRIIQGDCLEALQAEPDQSIHCCVTSPPYWGLRDYGVDGQIGLEKTPEEYVAKMVEVFREVWRVMRDDGTLWLNLGDSYAANRGYQVPDNKWEDVGNSRGMKACDIGLKPKDLVGIPWRVAFALQADGWYLRSDIIWHKPNPMPESVTDRPTKAHEYIFLLSKSPRYFYDAEAIKEPQSEGTFERFGNGKAPRKVTAKAFASEPGEVLSNSDYKQACPDAILPDGMRNKRTVWTVTSQPYPESHFATFPEDLIKPCIMAGTSAKGCCPKCGAPWERVVSTKGCDADRGRTPHTANRGVGRIGGGVDRELPSGYTPTVTTLGWQPGCDCGTDTSTPCTVLDPFGGSGTTGQVALELGRKAVLIELNPKYVELIERRTNVTLGLALA